MPRYDCHLNTEIRGWSAYAMERLHNVEFHRFAWQGLVRVIARVARMRYAKHCEQGGVSWVIASCVARVEASMVSRSRMRICGVSGYVLQDHHIVCRDRFVS